MRKSAFEKWQIKIFILCWIVYASVYFGRVNISVALPEIQNAFGWSKTQVGMIGSVFFWVYGIGHLINGYIGDKVSSRLYIFAGVVLIAITNICFGFATSLIVMVVLWGINGYFQSMIWGPMIKTLSFWNENKKRGKTATLISTSMVGGYILAWGLAGIIIEQTNWKWAFWSPGIFLLIYAIIWVTGIRNHPIDVGFKDPNEKYFKKESNVEDSKKDSVSFWKVVNQSKLWYVVVACAAKGIVKEGISLWGPMYLMETQGLDLKSTVGLILLIPFMNFIGMLFAGWLSKKYKNQDQITISVLFIISILTNIGLVKVGGFSAVLGLLFLSLSSAMMYGSNTILLGSIPMKYAKYNKTSSIAGFLDFVSYMAAGLTASITGLIVDQFGWNGVLVLWIAITSVGIIAMVMNHLRVNQKQEVML
ncbi:MFS transporter [Vallitalea okinawensis]|uniref:MFS transporter n=1 Tax=Vallitalea okinawensis TaxID=2078660 RepID=UPI000CFAB9CF|nr:MFS transporter [Vallitalea okinawensis]